VVEFIVDPSEITAEPLRGGSATAALLPIKGEAAAVYPPLVQRTREG
jgi:hypothetical protein